MKLSGRVLDGKLEINSGSAKATYIDTDTPEQVLLAFSQSDDISVVCNNLAGDLKQSH